MEALVLIFAEIIIACMAPVFAVIGALVGAIIEGIFLLLGGVFGEFDRERRAKRAAATGKPAVPRKPLIPRKVIHWAAGTCALVGVAGIAASYLFFQPILRYVMETASDKAGMTVAYESASGSLLGGHVVLEGLKISRVHETGLAFDLSVARAEADVDLWSLVSGTPRLILGEIEGVNGFVTPPMPKEEVKGLPKPRRPFKADRLAVSDVNLDIRSRDAEAYVLEIETAEVAPFRSGLALFDLLFRSNLKAKVAGQALIVETREITKDGRQTNWRFEDVDAAQLKRLVPRAPLTWIERGRATVAVSDRWSLSDNFVDMNWRMATEGLRTEVPAGARAGERLLAQGLGKLVAAQGGNVDFHYQLELDKTEMEALRSGDLDQFWEVVLSGVMKGGFKRDEAEDTKEIEPSAEAGQGRTEKAIDKLKSIFGKEKATE